MTDNGAELTGNEAVDDQLTRCPYCLTVFRVRGSRPEMGGGEVQCGTCSKAFDVMQNFVVQDAPGRFRPAQASDAGGAGSESVADPAVPGDHRTSAQDDSDTQIQYPEHVGYGEDSGSTQEDTALGPEDGPEVDDGSPAMPVQPLPGRADGMPDPDPSVAGETDASGVDTPPWGNASEGAERMEPGHDLPADDAVSAPYRADQGHEDGSEEDEGSRVSPVQPLPDELGRSPDPDPAFADEIGESGDESPPQWGTADGDDLDSSPVLPGVDAGQSMAWSDQDGRDTGHDRPVEDAGLASVQESGFTGSETDDDHRADPVLPPTMPDEEPLAELKVTPEPFVGNWFHVDPDSTMERNPFDERKESNVSDRGASRQSSISMNGVDDYIADRPNPLAAFCWFIVVVGFLFLLGLQVRTHFVDRYAQDERFRPYLSLFCRVAACELPARRDADSFSITNTRVDLHPDEPGAVKITVKLVNRAEFSQPYPDLQLTLIDRVGRVIGRRTFSPDFYLDDAGGDLLESGEQVSVDFNLAQPHEKAVGFVVEVVLESAA